MDSVKPLSLVMRFVLTATFFLNILTLVFLNKVLNFVLVYFGLKTSAEYYRFAVIFLYIAGSVTLYLLYQLVVIFKRISEGSPFVIENYLSLKKIAVCCLLISLLFFVKMFFYQSLLTIVAVLVFLVVGLCAYVFSQVFKQAVVYKDEIDFTI